MSTDDIAKEIERLAKEQFDRTINIPDGLTKDQAVEFVINAYRDETGVELEEAAVSEEVRTQMGGAETT